MKFFKNLFTKILEALAKRNSSKARRTVFSVFAAAIVLCTVSALVLPGITATANVYPLTETDITGVKLKVMTAGNGNWQTVGASTESLVVGVNDRLQFQLNYSLASETLSSSCDTISYQLPIVFSKVTSIEGNPVIDNGNEIGTYSITQDGLVTITFFPEMVSKNATVPIVGLFSFDCKVSDVIGTSGTQTVTIGEWSIDLTTDGGGGGGGDTTHHEEGPTETAPPQHQDMKVSKTHQIIDSANGVVDCTVIIEAEKTTDTAPLIYDWMATGFTYLQDFEIREVTLNADGTIKTFGNDVPGTTVVNGEESLVVGKRDFYFQCDAPMAKDAVYAITYRGKVIDPFSGSYHTNNQVKVITKIEGMDVESGYKDDIWLYNDNFVTKKGTFKDGSIEWTITVHRPANSVLDGWVLSDILEGYDYTGEATLTIGDGTPTTITFPYTFPAGSAGTTPENYVFTYSSPYEPKIGQTGVVNSVTYRPGDYEGDNPIVITETIGMDENNPLEKTVRGLTIDTTDAENTLAIVDWNVDITPTISAILGTRGYDWLYDDTLHDGQYLTPAQAEELEDVIVAEMTTKRGLERGEPPANENAVYDSAVQKQYTFELKRSENTTIPSGCFDRFTLHVYVDLAKDDQINFNYSSTGPSGDLDEEHSYENRGKVMQNAPGSHVYTVESWESAKYRPAILKTDPIPPTGTNKASSSELTTHEYYEVEGKLEWDLAVCVPNGIVTPVTLVDTLPAGVTFDSITMQVNKKYTTYGVAWDDDSTKTSGTMTIGHNGTAAVTRNGQTITVVLDEDAAQHYAGTSDTLNFRVVAALDQIPNYNGDDNAPHFSNTAAVKVPVGASDEMKTLGEDTQTQRITVDKYHGVLSKTVEQSSTDKTVGRIPYHIEINPDAMDLLEGTDTLILTDTLSAYCQNKDDVSVSLNPSTLHLYNRDETKQGNKGTPLDMSEYSYSYSSDYVDHHIKDYLTIHIPDERALVIEYTYVINTMGHFGSEVSNTVKLEGITDGEVTDGSTIAVDFTSSGAIAGLDGITLYKVDSKNYSLTLPDAQFTLYKYNGTAYALDHVVTTNANGMVQLTGLEEGYAYKLVETQAPENYVRDPDPYYFMMAGALETTAPSDFKGDLLQQGVAVYRPNISNYAEVNVIKQWQDENGSSVTHDGTVQFNLYRKIGTRDPNVTLTATITRRADQYATPVTVPFTPQQFQRGDTVEFVVTETRYRPGQNTPPDVTFYVNGDPRVVEPYWDPLQKSSDNATVTYTITFRMDDDTNVVADLGIIDADRPASVVARLSGTTLPPPTETSASSEPTQATYSIFFTDGGSGTVNGQPVASGARFTAGTQMTLVQPGATPGKRFTGWKVLQRTNHNNDVTATCLSGNVLTTPAFGVDVVAQYEDIPIETYDVTVYNNLGTASSDEAAEGSAVTVTANAPQPHYEFDHWVVVNSDGTPYVGADVVFANANSAETTFTMPNHAVVVEPKYKLKTAYTVTATADTGGTASYTITPAAETAADNKAYAGDTVTLSVPTVPSGKLFDKWVITSPATGFTFTVKDPNATFTMPASNVVVNATFRNKPDNLIMNGDFENVEGTITSSTGGFEWVPYSGLDQIGSSWSVVDGVLVYDSTNATSNTNWVAKIDPTYNNGNGLKPNTTYTLFADVNTNRDAHFYVGVKEGNKYLDTIPSLENDGYIQFTTGNDASIYSILVRMNKNERGGVEFSVDNVVLVEGAATEPPSGNPKHNINVTQPASGGTISANKSKEEAGKTVTLTAEPAAGYALDHWVVTEHTSGDSITVASNGTFTMPDDEVDVTAVFSQGTYTITVVGGTIYNSSDTTAAIHVGDTVEIQLDSSQIPAGQEFYRWDIYAPNSGVFINTGMAGDGHAEFRLDTANNVTLTATYQPVQHNITFTDGCGTASKNGTQVTTAGMGDTVKLTPNPPTGKVLDSWTVINDATSQPITVASDGTFTMPNSSVTVSATWKDAPIVDTASIWSTVSLKNNTNCSLTDGLSSPLSFPIGTDVTFTVMIPKVYQANVKTDAQLIAVAPLTANGVTITPDTIEVGTGVSGNFPVTYTYTVTLNEDTEIDGEIDSKDKGNIVIAVITSGGEEDGAYKVVVDSTIQHGTVTANPTSADEDDEITLTITPAEGYTLGTLTVTDSGGNPIAVTNNKFTMPASDVNVTATFAPLVANAFEEIVDRVTLSFYDADCTQYGITYHSYQTLTNPVIQYVSGSAPASWTGASTVTPTLSATVTGGKMKSLYDPTTFEQAGNEVGATDYVYKGALPALGSGTYTYRVGGKLPNGDEVWSDPYTFTANSASADPEMSFIWFSDSHYNTLSNSGTALRKVLTAADSLLPNGADMILSGGDFTDHGDLLYYAASAVDGNEDYFAQTPFFVASGNHDRKGVSSTASHIVNVDVSDSGGGHSGTGDYYSFDYNGVHVVVLDNGDENHSNVDNGMVNWLKTDLAASNAEWKLVMMHKPIYGPVQSGSTESVPTARGQLAGVFAQYGVDVVMQGHVHMYARSKPITDTSGTPATGYTTTTATDNGFTYDVTVNPGAPIYTVMGIAGATGNRTAASTQPAYLQTYASGQPYSFSAWRIEDDMLYVDAGYTDSTGTIAGYYEHFAISKDGSYVPPTPTTYAVNISDSIANGEVTTDKTTAEANTTVTLTVDADTGYELDTLTITKSGGGTITPTSIGNGRYTFTMPAEAVTVSATFTETGGGGGDNLIVNGDFSQGTTGWSSTKYADNWTVSNGQLVMVSKHGSSDDGFVPTLTTALKPNTTYTLYADISNLTGTDVGVKINTDNNHSTTLTSFNSTGYTFTTPNSVDQFKIAISVPKGNSGATATFDNFILVEGSTLPSGGGGETTTYNVTAATGLSHGTIASVSPASAAAGAIVTVKLSPESGYELDAWNITGGITPTATGNANEYTFQMPANDVTVSASFKSTGGGGGGGTNLLTNGDFSNAMNGWNKSGDVTVSNGQCNIFQSNAKLQQTIAVTSGKTYTLSFDVISAGGKATYGEVMQGGSTTATKVINQVVSSYPTRVSNQFTATADSVTIQIRPASGGSASLVVDNISLVEAPSNSNSPNFDDTPLLARVANFAMLGDTSGDVLVGTYTITASNSWRLLIENLISTEIVDGQEVFYVYYVEEVTPASDDFVRVAYDNNDGISSGDITIINTVSEVEREHIILPETGGGGNWPYVVGGVTLMTVCLFGGVVMTRRRRKASG